MNVELQAFELRMSPRGVVAACPYSGQATPQAPSPQLRSEAGRPQAGGQDRWAQGVASRFAEDEAAGLVALAAARVPPGVHASVSFWRDIAADFIRALCHVPEGENRTRKAWRD